MHVVTIACLVALAFVAPLGRIYLTGVAVVAALLAYEQSLVRADDLSQVKRAFDLNGYVGILYLLSGRSSTAVTHSSGRLIGHGETRPRSVRLNLTSDR